MRLRRGLGVAAAAAAAVIAAACVPVTAPPPPKPPAPPPGPKALVNRSTLVSGLNKPWDIAFLPGATGAAGSMLYTENDASTVSAYISSSTPRRVLITIPGVDTASEAGVMGIAVHPDFATNHYVYVCYTAASDNRVARYVMTLDGSGRPESLAFNQDVVTGMQKNTFHNGCRIRFQPGASPPALFVTMGDAGIGAAPQDVNSLNGKVLRVLDDGSMYPGNTSGKLWYTRGHRNPQGIAFRPSNGDPYSAEHGTFTDDEINRLENGKNAGWDPNTGQPPPDDYTSLPPMTNPSLPDVFAAVWSSGNPTIALSGIDFLGPAWGNWQGRIVGGVLKNHELRMFNLGPNGGISGTVKLFDDGATRLRVPVLGPDGALYVPTDMASPTGAIWRFTKA